MGGSERATFHSMKIFPTRNASVACIVGALGCSAGGAKDGEVHPGPTTPVDASALPEPPTGADAASSTSSDASAATPPSPPGTTYEGGVTMDSGGSDAAAPIPHPAYLLSADGVTDTYTLLGHALGNAPIDGPDCSHPAFGHHIAQSWDPDLGANVFDFFIHATPDNDRCSAFDRQRNEIKVFDSSAANLKGASGDTVTYQWKFRLDAKFQASPDFCHIHQIKGGDGAGAGAAPIITITPRHGTPDALQVIYSSPAQAETILTSTSLAPFLGTWVEASETILYNATGTGTYALTLRRIPDGAPLLTYSSTTLAMWALSTAASPTTYCRPKWGIYRSLNSPTYLRDEDVKFNDFCIAKNGGCPIDLP
jgi:hypothetical protein